MSVRVTGTPVEERPWSAVVKIETVGLSPDGLVRIINEMEAEGKTIAPGVLDLMKSAAEKGTRTVRALYRRWNSGTIEAEPYRFSD